MIERFVFSMRNIAQLIGHTSGFPNLNIDIIM